MARAYVYNMVDTWNAGATTFTAVKMNVTDTASAAGSLLMDLQVGGVSRFNVNKNGVLRITDPSASFGTPITSAALIVESTDAGAVGPRVNVYHNSASPADNDNISGLQFWANNSSAAATRFATMAVIATSVTAGAETGIISINTAVSGAIDSRFRIGNGLWTFGATGGDQGANTINASSFYANGNIIADTNALIRCRVYTVGTLPTVVAGARAFVSDANATTFASIVAGGGANGVPVYSDGTNWRIG